jgi:tricorn protease
VAAPFKGAPARLLRLADISADHIVFTYEADLWLVSDRGGVPRRLTTGHGVEQDAKFSPDGQWLAFTGEYDGGRDVYLMPAMGGEPRRLTFHPGTDQVIDWHPDGEHILFRSSRTHPSRLTEFYLIHRDGGLPTKVALDLAGLGSYAPDGRKLAYNRIPRENRTWKRYEGGMAQEIWIADFSTGAIDRATRWTGTDNYPMWIGDRVFFNSDAEDGTLNIWSLDPARPDADPVRHTHYADYDVKYPSSGAGRIVFQYQEQLHVLEVASGEVVPVQVDLRSDRVQMRPELVEISPRKGAFGLNPDGDTVFLEARGELVSVPVGEGPWKNLTRTSSSREKDSAWSPDGESIVFVSDRTGNEQLYVMPAGGGEWRQLTDDTFGMILPPVWSPDSNWILFGDKFMRLNLLEVKTGALKVIDQGEYDDAWERWGILDYVWSPDSRWVAYTKNTGNMHEIITLYDREMGTLTQVTDTMFSSWSPSFDPGGKYLWFLSNRSFEPIMGRVDQNHVFLSCARPYLVLLQDGVRSPFDPAAGDDEDKENGDEDDGDNGDTVEVVIDLEGIEGRVVVAAGVEAGNWFRLEAVEDGCLMLRRNEPIFIKYQNVNDRTAADDLTLFAFTIGGDEPEELGDGVNNYHLSADGSRIVIRRDREYVVGDAGKALEKNGNKIDLEDVRIRVDRDQEYRQIFNEAWRVQRDWFYDKNMHGEDWEAVRAKYERFLPWCGHRDDLRYLIGEMISELNIGHTYVAGGDYQGGGSRIGTGLLGCDFVWDPDGGGYRVTRMLPGWEWSERLVSPLAAPGVGVREGDVLTAIDGVALSATVSPLAALVDKAGKVVELEFSSGETVKVETLSSERALRYREWVEANRVKVAELSDGRIGYLHLPNMGTSGLIEFAAYFYPQSGLEAMIIDERYNGGGFVADMIIDRLERELWALAIPREGKQGRNPERALHGPIVVLINELTGSNGEFFAHAVKEKELAHVIGLRTWGGSIGIEPHQDLVDGGITTPPQFGLYGLRSGDWLIEGWGVEPHQEVMNEPADIVAGRDAQLEAAVAHLLTELSSAGDRWRIPPTPPYPDKSRPRMSGVNR